MPVRDSFFTPANLLSLARVPLGLLFAVVLAAPWGGPAAGLAVLVLAGITDALDGHIARRAYARQSGGSAAETPAGTGSWLDPICDKLFVATVLAAIWVRSRPPLALLALILGRELAQLPLSVIYAAIPALRRWLRYDFRASVLGKAATVLQFAAITALLFDDTTAWGMAAVSFFVGMLALGDYLRRAIQIGRRRLHGTPASAPGLDAR
ncbi:MAG: CDP-alcohol phosphatidyltransferase family protein [Pseudomonadota bacterium]